MVKVKDEKLEKFADIYIKNFSQKSKKIKKQNFENFLNFTIGLDAIKESSSISSFRINKNK